MLAIEYSKAMCKNLFAGALILLATGCQREPVEAKVSFVETRVDESQSPLPFVIALANSGNVATEVTGVSVDVVSGVALPEGEGADDGGFADIQARDCRVDMREGHPTDIPARGDGVAC